MTPEWVRANQKVRLSTLPAAAWPCNTLGNHDVSRIYSHYGEGTDNDEAIARISLALMLTLRGTPFLYNGEEIGMMDHYLQEIRQFKDLLGVWAYRMEIEAMGSSPEEALKVANFYGRDKCRTPMQWTNEPNAGFSPAGTQTWLPVNPNYADGKNVADQERDPESMLAFYRQIIALRKKTPALISGTYIPIAENQDEYLAYLRHSALDNQTCLILLNMSNRNQAVTIPNLGRLVEGLERPTIRTLYSNQTRAHGFVDPDKIIINPWEIYIAEVLKT